MREDKPLPLVDITASTRGMAYTLGELWRYRELIWFLAWRDVKVRYRQTLLGVAWAILQPTLLMLAFTAFLGRLGGTSSDAVPYPLFVLAGLLPWLYFSSALSNAAASVVASERLVTKVYFPRLAIPWAAVTAALADFACSLLVLAAVMIRYQVMPNGSLLLLPFLFILLTLAAAGIGSFLAALNVAYRDIRHAIPFLIQLWLFLTPAIYMSRWTTGTDHAAASRPWWIDMNPLNSLVDAFRNSVFGLPIEWKTLAVAAGLAFAAFGLGCWYFRRVEESFADVI